MQPVNIEYVGRFGQHFLRNAIPSSVQIALNNQGTAVCLFTSQLLECNTTFPRWSTLFTWTPSSFQPPSQLLDSWKQLLITYVKFIDVAMPDSEQFQSGLLVLLTNRTNDHSFICYFSDILTGCCCQSVISVRGVLTDCEWIYPVTDLCSSAKSQTIIAESIDLSCSEPKRRTGLGSVTSAFSGCVALGFSQGYIALLDLALDWVSDKTDHSVGSAVAIEKALLLQHVAAGKRVPSDPTTKEHITVYFDASVIRWNEFQYKSVSGKSLNTFPSASVEVSCLLYIPNSQTLAVGFSFGGWQLWSLRSMNLEFSLRHIPSESPVKCITFQEPSDDPRFCCYLWVGWQSRLTDDSCREASVSTKGLQQNAHAKLYQLSYLNRYEEPGSPSRDPYYRYEELVGFSERLSTGLFAVDSQKAGVPNQLLAIQPIQTGQSDSVAIGQSSSVHLISLIWRMKPTTVRIGLFDLDRWYHAQMPAHIRSDNSFFAVFDADVTSASAIATNGRLVVSSLSSFWSKVDARHRQLNGLWDLRMNGLSNSSRTTLPSLFGACAASNPVPEVCLRPSALSFSFLLICTSLNSPSPQCVLKLQFASRQEACVLSLSAFLPGSKTDGLQPKRFDITNWLSEAWATGLLESPGLDPLDEDDLERLLQFSEQLMLHQRVGSLDEAQAEQLGFRLAFGEDLNAVTLQELRDLILGVSHNEPLGSDRPRKRIKVVPKSDSAVPLPATRSDCSCVILCPSWVLLANCLLEHGHSVSLKFLHHLALGCGPHSPANPQFRKAWLWLRFQRLKGRFDRATTPMFDTTTSYSNSSLSSSLSADLHELGATLVQIHHLAVLARHWFQHDTIDSEHVTTPLLNAIDTFCSYTKLVAFLYRLGLLPQDRSILDVENFSSEFDMVEPKNTSSVLFPYQPELFTHVIHHLKSRSQSRTHEDNELGEDLILTDALLAAALGSASHVWSEQEAACVHNTQENRSVIDPHYPPRRLQSVCALWQLPPDSTTNNARLSLLGFLLCDAAAAAAYKRQKLHCIEIHPTSTPRMLALKLFRNVMSQLVRQFPTALPLLPTIFTLWLLDRGFFEEGLSSRLRAYVTGTDFVSHSTQSRFVCLFPNQNRVLKDYLTSCGQLSVWYRLVDSLPLDTAVDSGQANQLLSQSTLHSPVLGELRAVGTPFLALSQLRRVAAKFESMRSDGAISDEMSEKAHSMMRNILIELAEACRRAGRLGDLINLGLDEWEAQTLFEFYKDSGQYGIIFRCLLARKQYRSALSTYQLYQRATRERSVHELLTSNPTPSADRSRKELQLLSDLLIQSLPECYQDGCADCSPTEIIRSLSLWAKDVDAKSPISGVPYRRYSALECPLTSTKRSSPPPTLKRPASTLSSEHDYRSSLGDCSTPSPGRKMSPIAGVNLLNTARKGAAEFWETFREMESLELKFKLTSNTRASISANESRLSLLGGIPRQTVSIQPRVHRLFKSIYTPPPKRNVQSRETKTTDSTRFPADNPPAIDQRIPVSILKSPALRSTFSTPPCLSHSPDSKLASDVLPLNATLSDDMDVTLNLSTVRPSLNATPILHPVSRIVSTTVYHFSAPKSVSSPSSAPATESVEADSKSSKFQFAAPFTYPSTEVRNSSPIKSLCSPRKPLHPLSEVTRTAEDASVGQTAKLDSLPPTSGSVRLAEPTVHKPSQILPPWRFISSTEGLSALENLTCVPTDVTNDNDGGESTMDFDDTASVVSSTDDGSSISSETPRRSGRRVRPPKRFDPSKF
ncbi:unnamed protein product [Dicrocoelium dendriticum]|nr:unnamed protein product [Dicrocoelium dendriticum]